MASGGRYKGLAPRWGLGLKYQPHCSCFPSWQNCRWLRRLAQRLNASQAGCRRQQVRALLSRLALETFHQYLFGFTERTEALHWQPKHARSVQGFDSAIRRDGAVALSPPPACALAAGLPRLRSAPFLALTGARVSTTASSIMRTIAPQYPRGVISSSCEYLAWRYKFRCSPAHSWPKRQAVPVAFQ